MERTGEISIVGGAVMCLVHEARATTRDVDAFCHPASAIHEAARRVADRFEDEVPPDWINDAVKGILSPNGGFENWLEMSNLRVMTAQPAYLLAMKCMAMRLEEESHDIDDIRFLVRHLDLKTADQVLDTVVKYYPADRVPQKTVYALEEVLDGLWNDVEDRHSGSGSTPDRSTPPSPFDN